MDQMPAPEAFQEFVISGHGNLEKVQQMLSEQPKLLLLCHEWKPNDTETAIQGAAHVGSRSVAKYLLAQGAPMEICTVAMLGRRNEIELFLQEDPASIQATGAHGILLMTHAVLSGDVALTEWLLSSGANLGMSAALSLIYL